MERVLYAVQQSENIMFDMPKGAGSTSATLSVLLNWLLAAREHARDSKTRMPRLLCIVRNSQAIPGFVSSITKLPYKTGVSLFGGSRDQLCINPALSNSKRLQREQRCQALQECSGCNYYSSYRKNLSRIREVYSPRNLDIEDWKKEGTEEGFCPYYANRATSEDSPVVIATLQQMVTEDAQRLAEIAEQGVIYVEDADLLCRDILEGDVCSLRLDSSWILGVQQEVFKIKKIIEEGNDSRDLQPNLSSLNKLLEQVGTALQSQKLQTSGANTTLETLFGVERAEIFNQSVLPVLELLDKLQEAPSVSTKHAITTKKYFPKIESFLFKLAEILTSNNNDLVSNLSQAGFRESKTNIRLSECYEKARCLVIGSEYLPQDKAKLISILGVKLPFGKQVLSLPHSLSPLEQQFCLAVIPDIGSQPPKLFGELTAELDRVCQDQSISPSASRKILDLGTWLGRILQTVPGGVITVFTSVSVLRHCHQIWNKTGILAQMEAIKKTSFTIQTTSNPATQDPIDGCIPDFQSNENPQFSGMMANSKSESGTRTLALKKYLDNYKNPGAHLVMSSEDLSFIEQNLVGDEATRTVILLGNYLPEQAKYDHKMMCWGSYLSRLVGKIVSHANDYGMFVTVGNDFTTPAAEYLLPDWVAKLMANRVKYEIESGSFLEKAKRFFEDVARRNNSLKFEGDFKKGIGHPPTNGWALSQGLADSLKKLNAATPTDQSVFSRKFIPLNPERKQLYERLKSDAQTQLLAPKDTSMQAPEEKLPEKSTTKVKLNDKSLVEAEKNQTQKSLPLQSELPVNRTVSLSSLLGPQNSVTGSVDDSSQTITYVPNISSLRTATNTITWKSILTLLPNIPANSQSKMHLSCVICYEQDYKDFLVSKCGHVCCKECWDIRLKELMECPVCKDKVRAKTLIRVEGR
jgi:DEAD_2/Zinc finger, C3HC4 type (RING finger)